MEIKFEARKAKATIILGSLLLAAVVVLVWMLLAEVRLAGPGTEGLPSQLRVGHTRDWWYFGDNDLWVEAGRYGYFIKNGSQAAQVLKYMGSIESYNRHVERNKQVQLQAIIDIGVLVLLIFAFVLGPLSGAWEVKGKAVECGIMGAIGVGIVLFVSLMVKWWEPSMHNIGRAFFVGAALGVFEGRKAAVLKDSIMHKGPTAERRRDALCFIRDYLREKDTLLALRVYQETCVETGPWNLPESYLKTMIKQLNDGGNLAQAEALLRQYIERFPEKNSVMKLLLCKILIGVRGELVIGAEVLASIPPESLPPTARRVREALLRKACQT